MSVYTQEQQVEIVRNARDLTATIEAEEHELYKLKSEKFREMPKAPVRKVLPQAPKILPQYPPIPKANYSFGEHLKIYFNENIARSVVLLVFLFLVFFALAFLSYSEKLKEMNEKLVREPEYLKARAEAEKVAVEQQKEADDKVRADQEKLDNEYEENKHNYETVIIPKYKEELLKWEENQQRKIQIIENELELNKETLNQLYNESKLISVTYRELKLLAWIYEDMNSSDHDIRYATELLDRNRQMALTEKVGLQAQNAINNMNQTMKSSFSALYSVIEEGNELQGETINILSKARRDINIGNVVGTVQRHNTNKYLDGMTNKK